MRGLESFGQGIHALDAGYLRPGLAAIHLIVEQGRAALVDTGTQASLPAVLTALNELGITCDAVDWILLSHVHLDHAGGAGALMEALPQARLLVHPRGARHMIDPSRLWAGVIEVYGEAFARASYGELLPVPATRVVEACDGMTFELSGRRIEVIDAPGHARHHVCYYDELSRAWFTGDCFGLAYREIRRGDHAFVFPTTTPVQFDPAALHASVIRMMEKSPERMFLTHHGEVLEPERLARDLHRLVDACVTIARSAAGVEGVEQLTAVRAGLEGLLRREAREQGWALQGDEAVALHAIDLDLNAQGLQVWLKGQE